MDTRLGEGLYSLLGIQSGLCGEAWQRLRCMFGHLERKSEDD